MKFIKLTGQLEIGYVVRHWGRWYFLLNDGGLVNIGPLFNKADLVAKARRHEDGR